MTGTADRCLNVALVSVPDANNVTFATPTPRERLEIGQLAFAGLDGPAAIKAQASASARGRGLGPDGSWRSPERRLRVPFDFGFGFDPERFFTEGGIQWPTGAGSGLQPSAARSAPRPGYADRVRGSRPGGLEEVLRYQRTAPERDAAVIEIARCRGSAESPACRRPGDRRGGSQGDDRGVGLPAIKIARTAAVGRIGLSSACRS